jgi:PIN domain nuclease of toxin-antitoxin system
MRFLIDTHTFLWFVNDSNELSNLAKSLLESEADLYLSLASLWEIAIKLSSKKLTLTRPFNLFISEQLRVNEIEILVPDIQHFEVICRLPFHHRDPFDRLIIAQAIVEKIPIISIDSLFDSYEIERFW